MMIKCCNDHIELALDMYVDKYDVPPKMKLLSDEEKLSTPCKFYQNKATYVVGN